MAPTYPGRPPGHPDYLWIGEYPRVRNGNPETVSAHWRRWPERRTTIGFMPIASGLTASRL